MNPSYQIQSSSLVSVIMNCFNGEKFLKIAIDSVYEQTYQNWEIVFWDNGSTDDSAKIAKSYDNKIRYFHTNDTIPLGMARNKAIEKSKGEYISFLDVDDIWEREKLEEQMKLFHNDKIGLVYSDFWNLYPGSRLVSGKTFYSYHRGSSFKNLLEKNFIVLSTAICKKKVINEFNGFPDYKYAEEYDLFLKISHKYLIDYVDKPLVKYRYHENNFSLSNFDLQIKEVFEIYDYWLKYDGGLKKIIDQAKSFDYYSLSKRFLFHSNDRIKSRYYLNKAKSFKSSYVYILIYFLTYFPSNWVSYLRVTVQRLLNWHKPLN